jgi:hypothetical protein
MLIGFGISPSRVKVTGGAAAFDADAQAFFTAASITDSTQKSAVNQLVLDLKSYNIWTKMKALYPIVGGSAATHKWNLKDPRDLNAAYRLTFATGMTHSSTGMVSNGTTGYADTQLISGTQLTLNSTHISYYSRSNVESTALDMGAFTVGTNQFLVGLRYTAVGFLADQYNSTTGRITAANANSQGFYLSNRTTSAIFKAFKNGTQLGTTQTGAGNVLVNLSMFLCASNGNGTPTNYSTRQCAFASIGDGLTDTEAANFYTAVQAYQTTLSRQV